jgi:hypothetical protein
MVDIVPPGQIPRASRGAVMAELHIVIWRLDAVASLRLGCVLGHFGVRPFEEIGSLTVSIRAELIDAGAATTH